MEKPTLADDMLEGVAAIAEFTGFKPRRIFYLAEGGKLPLFKVGSKWCGRKSTLLAYVTKLEESAGGSTVAA